MIGAFYQRSAFIAINFLFWLVVINNVVGGLDLGKDHREEEFYYTASYGEKKKLSASEIRTYLQSRKRFYQTIKGLLVALVVGYVIWACGSGSQWRGWPVSMSLPWLLVSGLRRWEEMDPEGFGQRSEGEVALAVVEDKSFLGKLRTLFDFGKMKLIGVIKTNQRLILYGCKDERYRTGCGEGVAEGEETVESRRR